MKKIIQIQIEILLIVFLISIFALVFSGNALAQAEESAETLPEENAVETPNQEANEKAVYINAARLEYQEDKTLLSGGVKIRKNETIIKALKGELFRDEQKMILTEEIKVEYPDGRVSSELLTAFLEKEEYIFENQAVLNYMLSDDKEMILQSNHLKIFGDNNSFTARKEVEIDYDNQKFKGEQPDYNGKTEKMDLTGNVKIEEDDDWIKSDKAKFNFKEGEEGYTAEGNVEVKMILD